jgi:hypothetical protein
MHLKHSLKIPVRDSIKSGFFLLSLGGAFASEGAQPRVLLLRSVSEVDDGVAFPDGGVDDYPLLAMGGSGRGCRRG